MTPKDSTQTGPGVVDLEAARSRLKVRQRPGTRSRETLLSDLEEMRVLLDQGRASEVKTHFTSLMGAIAHDPSLLAEARCMLSAALEMQGRYRDSFEALAMYATPESQKGLSAEALAQLRVHIGLAYYGTGDCPKAIALLNAALREIAEQGTDEQIGSVYVALARVYRIISEFPIARDHSQKALEHYRHTGNWRGLAEAYFGIAMADTFEGNYVPALENFEQALKLIGDNPAPYLLGKIYTNMAADCWFLKKPHEGIRYLEKAVGYYESTEHKGNAAEGYNNLGINLLLVGEWARAQVALERSLELCALSDGERSRLPMALDSLGELCMLRGDLEGAMSHLRQAVELSLQGNNKWYSGQCLRTLGRCQLALNDAESALENAQQALSSAESIGDRYAICESHLLLAEALLRGNRTEECKAHVQKVTSEITDSVSDLNFAGEAQRLFGLLALGQDDAALAAQHFGRCISIFEMLGDRYRSARSHYDLGCAYKHAHPERAIEHLSRAAHSFRELGAMLDLNRAEETLARLDRDEPEQQRGHSAVTQLLTLRLAEAVASRELLLRELVAVIHQETNARRILVVEAGEEDQPKVAVAHGCGHDDGVRLAKEIHELKSNAGREKFSLKHDAYIVTLHAANAPAATLFISPRTASTLPGNLSIEPLLRVVELAMDVCALRAHTRASKEAQAQNELTGTSLMPGFIHSSPAMTRLVEEVHKIRSSDVTVLVTGESGTGKELVARAIHAISSRRSKVFVPFNCTAVPKELSEGYLFGYRRGSFTGAMNDSPGVIRTAAGGTLFLDEIGDLPLDVQPKLLRFLQEGEIQPLGEQRPIQVDVRIIAATNTDLEEMVAQGRFREDLYYRLNVIRLRVPPLRERRSEIPTIVSYYINHYSAKFGRRDISITPQAVDLLMVSDWPGNVRQLCNEVQRIVARAEDGTELNPDHLSPELKRMSAPASTTPNSISPLSVLNGPSNQHLTLEDAITDLERRMISEALRKHAGNISRAARELGLTRRGLYLKLERYAISASA
jgi:hydrogenase-4 transcriptional activator